MKARAICPRIEAPTPAAQECRVGARTEFGGSGIGGIPVSWNPGAAPYVGGTHNGAGQSYRSGKTTALVSSVRNSHTRAARICRDVVCARGPHEKTSRGFLLTQRARQWPVLAVGRQPSPIVVPAGPRDRVRNNTPEVLTGIGRHASDTAQATGVAKTVVVASPCGPARAACGCVLRRPLGTIVKPYTPVQFPYTSVHPQRVRARRASDVGPALAIGIGLLTVGCGTAPVRRYECARGGRG